MGALESVRCLMHPIDSVNSGNDTTEVPRSLASAGWPVSFTTPFVVPGSPPRATLVVVVFKWSMLLAVSSLAARWGQGQHTP
jgi:hypothetical protein